MTVVDTREALGEEREKLKLVNDDQGNALCLSGGGIRSAAFGLGVIQALAEVGLLKRFHYLSTVSGGGYIGGWLTRLIASKKEELPPDQAVSLKEIEVELAKPRNGFEMPELRGLRRYTNYLAPRLGPLSADVWAGIVLWLRNTLINWLVFGPLFVAIASLPLLYATLIAVLGMLPPKVPPSVTLSDGIATAVACALAVAAPLMFGIILYRTIIELPSHSFPRKLEPPPPEDEFGKPGRFLHDHIVRWALAWSVIAPLAIMPIQGMTPTTIAADIGNLFEPTSSPEARTDPKATNLVSVDLCETVRIGGPPCAAVRPVGEDPTTMPQKRTWMIGLVAAATFGSGMVAYRAAWRHVEAFEGEPDDLQKQLKPFEVNGGAWLSSCAISALLNGLGVYIAFGFGPIAIAVAGPLWVIVTEILRSTLYIALRREALRGDLDREWSARLNGAMLKWVLIYSVGAVLVLLAPGYFKTSASYWIAISSGGAASGTVAALLGKSAKTMLAARKPDGSALLTTRVLINAAIVLFAVSLVLIAGRAAAISAEFLAWIAESIVERAMSRPALGQPVHEGFLLVAILAIAYLSRTLPDRLGSRINLNNFSMHAVYRNRLVRAFLGTARSPKRWRPDRYTRFDPRDDVRMASAFDNRLPIALLPVVNVALNRTSGKDMARAERKAIPFTITPFRCGFASPRKEKPDLGFYATTRHYAGNEREFGPADEPIGISLGTAIALSGAAASPNMGYHSSPLTAFVMTLFNVRLGAWLPNPAWSDPDPKFLQTADADGISPMLDEIVGHSDDVDRYVYLSDGGHFDNLALYEMLRRRCRFMVVVDAGQDASYAYADLSMLIQHASIDFDIKVDFASVQQVGETSLQPAGTLANVTYPEISDELDEQGKIVKIGQKQQKGTILYLKPWLAPDAPMELRAFKVLRPKFPHEPTTNQFFTETDFESYRQLGRYIAQTALKGLCLGRARHDEGAR
ncbi:MAG: patatin-like phospholipase family protein [Janthinobacterium lividum]